jgi:hypothetical protein
MNWPAFRACLKGIVLGNSMVNNEEAIDKCIEELTCAIQEALAASAAKHRPHTNPQPPFPINIQDEIYLKNLLKRQGQVMTSCSESQG